MNILDLDPICSVCRIDADGKTAFDAIRWSSVRKFRYLPEPRRILVWIADEENKTWEYLISDQDTERLIAAVHENDRRYNRPHNAVNVPLEFAACMRNGVLFTIIAKQG